MRYLDPKFSVGSPGTQAYADAWDRIFKQPKILDVPSECAEAPTDNYSSVDVCESELSFDVTVEVSDGYEAAGGSRQGAGGEGEVTGSAPPSSETEGGVSRFPDLKAPGATR